MADVPVEKETKQEESPIKFFEGCECLSNYKRLELKFKKLEELIVKEKSEDIKKLEKKTGSADRRKYNGEAGDQETIGRE